MNAVTLAFDRSGLATLPLCAGYLRAAPAFVVPDVQPDVLLIARRAWEDRTCAEYTGVMLVRHFHGLLVDLNAPMDLQELAIVMLLHEQQHAALCREAAVALGSDALLTIPLDELQFHRQPDPALELLQMVAGTYAVGEVTALGLLRHTLGVLPDSGFREVLVEIARDEGLHARIGPHLLKCLRDEPWFPWPGDAVVQGIVAAQRDSMAARDVIEPDEAALFTDPIAAGQLMALGTPDSTGFLAAYHSSLGKARAGLEPLGLWPDTP